MGQLLGAALLIIILGSFLDAHYYGNPYARGYHPYYSQTSPTGYAVQRRYYDTETGDSYVANTPVYVAYAYDRQPRGTINYGGYDFPDTGVQARSY